jgi:nicotinate-nucleotide adenylyltransferase
VAHLVVVPRAGSDRELFYASIERYWPGTSIKARKQQAEGKQSMQLNNGGWCTYLTVPRLDVSASFIRERWLAGRNLAGLVPEGVQAVLAEHKESVTRIWMEAQSEE